MVGIYLTQKLGRSFWTPTPPTTYTLIGDDVGATHFRFSFTLTRMAIRTTTVMTKMIAHSTQFQFAILSSWLRADVDG